MSVSEGLSQSTINAIFQDRDGYIWLGTEDGLNRFDGLEFIHHKFELQNHNSLSNSWIWAMTQDGQGDLWVATYNGLCRMSHRTGQIKRFFPEENNPKSISSTRPDCLLFDRSGRLWIGTWGGGLNLFDDQDQAFHHYFPDASNSRSLSHLLVRTLFEDSEGNIWIGTWGGGLCRYDPDTNGFERGFLPNHALNYLPGNEISSIAEATDGSLWIGTFQNGISILDRQSGKYVELPDYLGKVFFGKSITSIIKDTDHRMWVGTRNDGLFVIDKTQIKQYLQLANAGIKGDFITAIFQESGGTVLVGNNGLSFYHNSQSNFTTLRKGESDGQGLKDGNVWCFAEMPNKKLWIGTQNGGIDVYDLNEQVFQSGAGDMISQVLPVKYIRTIIPDRYGSIWIGTIGAGLVKMDNNARKIQHLDLRSPYRELAAETSIMAMESADTIIYIGAASSGVFTYNLKSEKVDQLPTIYNDTVRVSSQYVRRIFIDHLSTVWIGTWGGGFGMLNQRGDTLTRYLHDDNNPKSLSDNIINDIYEDTDGNLWIGTNYGLNRLVKKKSPYYNSFDEELIVYTQKDGLANEVIYAIQGDELGHLWLSTNFGLSRFDKATGQIVNFGSEDGLQDSEFNAGASARLQDGRIVFGGISGLNVFHPEEVMVNDRYPPLRITRAVVAGKPVNLDSLAHLSRPLVLPYNMAFISLEYAAIDYIAPQKIKYAYKMEGVEQELVEAGHRRTVTYANLAPGSYQFQLTSTNRDGIWNPGYITFDILITPPFWRTWWFIALSLLLITAAIYTVFKIRIERALEIERLRTRIATDLHDDIGASLTKISLYSDLIRTQKGSKNTPEFLLNISELSREVIGSMSDIVWSIDSRHDDLEEVIDRMKEYASGLCESAGIALYFEIDGLENSRKLKAIMRQNVYLICKEAINNSVKHSKASAIKIAVQVDGRYLTITISDNGAGLRNERKGTGGNGIKNMKSRAEMIGGTIDFVDQDGLKVVLGVRLDA